MVNKKIKASNKLHGLPKSPTDIPGLDEIMLGGLPKYRTTLIAGEAGSGKTLLSLEYLIKGTTVYNERGLFIAFEEYESDLLNNFSSLNFELDTLVRRKKNYSGSYRPRSKPTSGYWRIQP